MGKTRLYIGIETKVREFEAKALLACVAAEAGYDVVLGQQRVFLKTLEMMSPGIVINKSVSPRKAAFYAHYRKLGFRLAAYDEEGLLPFNADEYKKRRISAEAIKYLDYFFAWGPWQAGIVAEKAPAEKGKIVPVGHPRADLTRREWRGFYAEDVKTLRDRYGRFILINTNFSFYNHFRGRDFEIILREKAKVGKVVDEAHRQYYLRVSNHKKQLFYAFVEMAVNIRQRFPDIAVVLRPHPSEDHDYWRQVLPKDEKIHVVHEGNVLPWILAAEVMIHNSCTTGIEGYLLEQPVLSYRPVQDEEVDGYLSNAVSDQEFTLPVLLDKLAAYLASGLNTQKAGDPQKREIAARYITSLDGSLSCERIMERLKTVQIPAPTLHTTLYRLSTKVKKFGGRILNRIMPANPSDLARNEAREEYRFQKFPGIEYDEVERIIAKFQALSGRFTDVRIVQLQKNLFQIIREG
jgi:surface carbohydrate biosynthesis protein